MIAWLLSLAIALSPPGKNPARETEAAALIRYASIVEDVSAVVDEAPPLPGETRATTAALLISIGVHESALRLDVDEGLTRSPMGAVCILQLLGAPHEVETDRRACLREGLRIARRSFAACRALPPRERLAAYASGSCKGGKQDSREMIDSWRRAVAAHPVPRGVAMLSVAVEAK